MKLYELAFTRHIYDAMTNYHVDYLKFLERTKPGFEMGKLEHRQELINWLNQWGCRQFALAYHDHACEELLDWYKGNCARLVPGDKPLWELTVEDIEVIPEVYDSLAERIASKKKDGRIARFGPTGASKILFALRPLAMIPWDIPIRTKLNSCGDGYSYVEYLVKALRKIESLMTSCQSHNIEVEDVPKVLGRNGATVAQMVGEYFWVTLTRECIPPPVEVAERWLKWSK